MKDNGKAIYFASDFHLGTPNKQESALREKQICSWLDHVSQDAKSIFLVGDLFDFWFEYKTCIPKGHIRFQAKIAEIVEKGIEVHFFHGNHDMWMFDYFKEELGVHIHKDNFHYKENGKRFFIAHGDGIGPGDLGYKSIKLVFRNKICQWLFARLHPNFGIKLAEFLSKSSRGTYDPKEYAFKGWEKEHLFQYSKKSNKKSPHDYFIYGHRHLPLKKAFDQSMYINLGEWIHFNSYGRFFQGEFELLQWKNEKVHTLQSQHEI